MYTNNSQERVFQSSNYSCWDQMPVSEPITVNLSVLKFRSCANPWDVMMESGPPTHMTLRIGDISKS